MTTKYNLEQNHKSFQEDGGEKESYGFSISKYQFIMRRKYNLEIKWASVYNVGAIPLPWHYFVQTIPLLYFCVINMK